MGDRDEGEWVLASGATMAKPITTAATLSNPDILDFVFVVFIGICLLDSGQACLWIKFVRFDFPCFTNRD